MYSIVVPAYNEQETIEELWRRITAVMASVGGDYEVLFVDDGSTDATPAIIRRLHAQDPRVRLLRFSRNFGHQAAITAGLDYARGQAVIVMDADLQDPPEVIPAMIAKWREGYDVVYAVRKRRHGEGLWKRLTAALYYRLLARLAHVPIPYDTGDFRLMSRAVVDVLRELRERARFLRGLSAWVGFRQVGIEYERAPRYAGTTKYSVWRMTRFALDGITAFSSAPLYAALYIGIILLIGVALGLGYFVGLGLVAGRPPAAWAWVALGFLFLMAWQFIALGLLGLYIARIHDEVKGRPLYVVAETLPEPSGPASATEP
ncbi:putative glycosyltransferase [bacterium HR11]|nr:putative glycosyltransferase [bacterium HR11]